MSMCEGCTNEQHYLCGMQTWCECECDGSTDWGLNEIDPYEGLAMCCGARRFGKYGPACYQPENHQGPHIFECESSEPE